MGVCVYVEGKWIVPRRPQSWLTRQYVDLSRPCLVFHTCYALRLECGNSFIFHVIHAVARVHAICCCCWVMESIFWSRFELLL